MFDKPSNCDNSGMEINQQCVVALTWTLEDTLGEELDVLDEPVEFLVGGSDLLQVIDAALQKGKVGDVIDLQIEPEQGFGDFNEELIFIASRKLFPGDLEVGTMIDGTSLPDGCLPDANTAAFYTVSDIYPSHVVLDGNHPLAGIALHLQLKVWAVRKATSVEAHQGSVGTGFFKFSRAHAVGNITLH